VQAALVDDRAKQRQNKAIANPNLLRGRVYDECGNLMSPHHARNRNGQKYRYYVSRIALRGSTASKASISRVPATMIEALVESEIVRRLPPREIKKWKSLSRFEKSGTIRDAVCKVVVGQDDVEIRIAPSAVKCISVDSTGLIRVPTQIKPWGGISSVIGLDGEVQRQSPPDINIARILARARIWLERLKHREVVTIRELSCRTGEELGEIRKYLPLAFLSPMIVAALVDREKPLKVTLPNLVKGSSLIRWADQERVILGEKNIP